MFVTLPFEFQRKGSSFLVNLQFSLGTLPPPLFFLPTMPLICCDDIICFRVILTFQSVVSRGSHRGNLWKKNQEKCFIAEYKQTQGSWPRRPRLCSWLPYAFRKVKCWRVSELNHLLSYTSAEWTESNTANGRSHGFTAQRDSVHLIAKSTVQSSWSYSGLLIWVICLVLWCRLTRLVFWTALHVLLVFSYSFIYLSVK